MSSEPGNTRENPLSLKQRLSQETKERIFAAMAANGIKSLTIGYDGSGDEGFVGEEGITVEASGVVGLNDIDVPGEGGSLADIVEEVAESLLEHFQWEDGEGSRGSFTFKDGKILQEHGVRVIETEDSYYEY